MVSHNSHKTVNNRKKRWAFRSSEAVFNVIRCLQESSIPSFDLRLFRSSAITPTRNICLFTGSAKTVYYKLKASRHAVRKRIIFGSLFGLQKSIW